jgi:hypothetical protein
MDFQPSFKERSAQEATTAEAVPTQSQESSEDDSLDFFKSLAED